ncbi:MAG: MBL fold metallo-hydrolase [Bdellovibrionota bacterium]
MKAKRVAAGSALALSGVGFLAYGIGWAVSAPGYKGEKSDHFDGKMFHNLKPLSRQRGKDFLNWMLSREPGKWPDWIDAKPGPKPPERVGRGELRTTFVGHACVLVQMDGMNFLTDPHYSERTSPVSWVGPRRRRPPGIRFEDLPPIDAVLVSHNHYDHLDIPTLQRLAKEHRLKIFTGLGNSQLLESSGIQNSKDLDWWQGVELTPEIRVTFVPAQHFSSRGLADRNQTLWGGFVIEGPAGKVYFAGDTGMGPHFEMIREKFGEMRLALLPIGAFNPSWFMGPVHTSPEEAVEAHKILGAAHSIPIHYGTFPLADDSYEQPLEALEKALVAANLSNPAFKVVPEGEGWDVPETREPEPSSK